MNEHYCTPKVSILVPVYNVERYLPQCLDSLISQTLKDIQIICINDGSTDSSLEILKCYAQKDKRIEIIDKPNSGYGASMNCGLDLARGEYVGITESDDFADKKMFSNLYRYAKFHNCDLVKSNYYEHCAGSDVKREPFAGFRYRRVFNPIDQKDIIKVLPIIWTGLYRRQMLVDEGIRFNETPGASFQDTSFVHRVWFAAKRVAILRGCYLHYRVDNENSSVKSVSKVFEVCGEYALTEAFLRENSDRFKEYAALLQVMKFDTYRWNYNRIADECKLGFASRWSEEFKSAREDGILNRDYFCERDWLLIQEIMGDPKGFCRHYVEL